MGGIIGIDQAIPELDTKGVFSIMESLHELDIGKRSSKCMRMSLPLDSWVLAALLVDPKKRQ